MIEEDLLKPGRLSQAGFLGEDERLIEVIAADEVTLKKLGITFEQVADRIEYFIIAVNYPTNKPKIVDSIYEVTGTSWRGMQECPWGDRGEYSNMDFQIKNTKTGESILFPGLIVHLIRKHHFFEGKKSSYRVEPKRVIEVLGIK